MRTKFATLVALGLLSANVTSVKMMALQDNTADQGSQAADQGASAEGAAADCADEDGNGNNVSIDIKFSVNVGPKDDAEEDDVTEDNGNGTGGETGGENGGSTGGNGDGTNGGTGDNTNGGSGNGTSGGSGGDNGGSTGGGDNGGSTGGGDNGGSTGGGDNGGNGGGDNSGNTVETTEEGRTYSWTAGQDGADGVCSVTFTTVETTRDSNGDQVGDQVRTENSETSTQDECCQASQCTDTALRAACSIQVTTPVPVIAFNSNSNQCAQESFETSTCFL